VLIVTPSAGKSARLAFRWVVQTVLTKDVSFEPPERTRRESTFKLDKSVRSSMTRRFSRLRRFHFNFPQRVAAGLLALFLIQGLWITGYQTLSDRDYQYARCGRET
jgi:hypothetical protein